MRTVHSPAKINLHLCVFEKHPDGYHRVETSMVKISLSDRIDITLHDGKGIEVIVDEPFAFLTGPQNLVYKATSLFLQATKTKRKIVIRIQKNIPIGAGLGGGSGNAGVVLKTLNQFFDRPLDENKLMELGRQLGADVPFFIQDDDFGLMKGRGDILVNSRTFPSLPVLIVYPNIEVSTKDVYQRLGRSLTWEGAGAIEEPDDRGISAWKDIDFLLKKGNDLQPVTEAMHPVIGKIRKTLLQHGASFAQMSGSGAAVFGLFDDVATAEKAMVVLEKNNRCFVVRSGATN